LTIDFPEEQHTYLKMLAAKSGISMKQFVINALSQTVESRKGDGKLGKNKFKKLLKETVEEYDDVLRRLADK
jgi:hypothetical protein